MKHPVYFPLYNIQSDLVKTALGLKDNRSIEKWLQQVGINIQEVAGKKLISCEDLMRAPRGFSKSLTRYSAISNEAQEINNLK